MPPEANFMVMLERGTSVGGPAEVVVDIRPPCIIFMSLEQTLETVSDYRPKFYGWCPLELPRNVVWGRTALRRMTSHGRNTV